MEFVVGVLGSATAGVVSTFREILGNDRICGARVTMPNGTRIELESVSVMSWRNFSSWLVGGSRPPVPNSVENAAELSALKRSVSPGERSTYGQRTVAPCWT